MRVSTESLDHGYDVCGVQAAGNWAGGRMSLFMCFIDLQKAHDTVDKPSCGRYSFASEYHRR